MDLSTSEKILEALFSALIIILMIDDSVAIIFFAFFPALHQKGPNLPAPAVSGEARIYPDQAPIFPFVYGLRNGIISLGLDPFAIGF
jgi:hypothetical protein